MMKINLLNLKSVFKRLYAQQIALKSEQHVPIVTALLFSFQCLIPLVTNVVLAFRIRQPMSHHF